MNYIIAYTQQDYIYENNNKKIYLYGGVWNNYRLFNHYHIEINENFKFINYKIIPIIYDWYINYKNNNDVYDYFIDYKIDKNNKIHFNLDYDKYKSELKTYWNFYYGYAGIQNIIHVYTEYNKFWNFINQIKIIPIIYDWYINYKDNNDVYITLNLLRPVIVEKSRIITFTINLNLKQYENITKSNLLNIKSNILLDYYNYNNIYMLNNITRPEYVIYYPYDNFLQDIKSLDLFLYDKGFIYIENIPKQSDLIKYYM